LSINPLDWRGRVRWPACVLPTLAMVAYTAHEYGTPALIVGLQASSVQFFGTVVLVFGLFVRARSQRETPKMRLWLWAALGGAAAASVGSFAGVVVRAALRDVAGGFGLAIAVPALDAVLIGGVVIAIAASFRDAIEPWGENVFLVGLGYGTAEAIEVVARPVANGQLPGPFGIGLLPTGIGIAAFGVTVATIVAAGVFVSLAFHGAARKAVAAGSVIAAVAFVAILSDSVLIPSVRGSLVALGCWLVLYLGPIVALGCVANARGSANRPRQS
jgi:hypothetical protein